MVQEEESSVPLPLHSPALLVREGDPNNPRELNPQCQETDGRRAGTAGQGQQWDYKVQNVSSWVGRRRALDAFGILGKASVDSTTSELSTFIRFAPCDVG